MVGRNRFFLFFIAVLSGMLFSITATYQTHAQQTAKDDTYLIDVGDSLEINVWKEDDFSRQTIVRLDGRISLPLVGDIKAAGNTPMQLAKKLEKKLSEIMEEPSITVIVLATNSRKYYMVGNINSPGEYPIDTPINILQAIARASGLGEWADKDEIIIVRRGAGKDEMIFFDYKEFVKGKDLSKNIYIQYGDTVIVP
jgi:polysaccharide export outer membrane protein